MFVELWELLTLVSRTGIYLAVAGALGGAFSLLVFARSALPAAPLWRYLRWSCLLGLLSIGCYFFVRTAALGNSVSAAFDPTLLSIVSQSVLGDSAKLLTAAFAAALLASFSAQRAGLPRKLGIFGLLLAIAALLYAFPLSGHVAEHAWPSRLALMLHVLAMSLWIGSFYPLLYLMGDPLAEYNLKLFGRIAVGIVGLLLACGTWLGFILTQDFSALLSTNYGRTLVIKIGLICLLLLIAASHKWYWVPKLAKPGVAIKLKTSIRGELALGLGILLVTSTLATLLSPGQ